jgi:hypothetical protein
MSDAETPVIIEVVLLDVRQPDDELGFRTVQEPFAPGTEPDTAARRMSHVPAGSGLLHSTSWRFDDGQIVLTYVALPDPDPEAPHRPVAPRVARGDDATSPSPDDAADAEVAAHACRHLAFLAETDDDVGTALRRYPEISQLLRQYQPDLAGQFAAESAVAEPGTRRIDATN